MAICFKKSDTSHTKNVIQNIPCHARDITGFLDLQFSIRGPGYNIIQVYYDTDSAVQYNYKWPAMQNNISLCMMRACRWRLRYFAKVVLLHHVVCEYTLPFVQISPVHNAFASAHPQNRLTLLYKGCVAGVSFSLNSLPLPLLLPLHSPRAQAPPVWGTGRQKWSPFSSLRIRSCEQVYLSLLSCNSKTKNLLAG